MVEVRAPRYETIVSQAPAEIAGFIEILQREGVKNFLEIGSRFGGSLWRIAMALPKGGRIVSCDSGKGMGGKKPGARDSLKACVARLRAEGYDAHLVVGHSQDPAAVAAVRALGPFDAVFIDGDHEYRGVFQDWKNYGRMARIVAFHDIAWVRPEDYAGTKEVQVPRLWQEVKEAYRSAELIDRSGGHNMGIGVLWR